MFDRTRVFVVAVAVTLAPVTILSLIPGAAQAQQIEEIVVTARKKEESLQDVPLSIAAFSSEQLQERGVLSNYGVAAFTPNFSTSQRVGRDNDRPVIRGMSAPGNRGEPNASYFIDGVFVARTISTANTNSMERVEVLRGPQSAQFGRATFAGAVNYITRRPTNEMAGEVFARAGTSDEKVVSGWWSGPIVEDKLLFLVSGAYDEYGGQWNNNLQPDTVFVNGTQPPASPILTPGLTDTFSDTTDPFNPIEQNDNGDTTPLGEQKTWDLLAKLAWLPTENSEVNLKYMYTRGEDGHYPNNVFDKLNCFLPTAANVGEPWYATSAGAFCGESKIDGTDNRKNIPDLRNGLTVLNQGFFTIPPGSLPPEKRTSAPVEPGLRRETHRLFGGWVQEIGDWVSELKLSWSDDDFDSAYDLDHQPVRAVWGLFGFNNQFETSDWSFEYAVETPVDKPWRAKAGVYYYDQERLDRQRSATGPLAWSDTEPGTAFQDPRVQNIQNSSVFGSLGFDLAENWTLDFEARYAKDDLSITSGQRTSAAVSDPVSDQVDYTAFTPRVTLQYMYSDDLNFYFLVAKGNKPGGFNTEFFRSDVPSEWTRFTKDCQAGDSLRLILGGAPQVFECDLVAQGRFTYLEETQWTYETGMKSTWLDNRILANLSVFFIDWRNQGLFTLQDYPSASGATNTSTVVTNAGKSKIYGLELETNFIITDELSMVFNYGYNYGEFIEGFDPDIEATTGNGNLKGNRLFDSPDHSGVLSLDWRRPINDTYDGFVRGDFLYDSKRYNSQSNLSWIGERKIVNLRTGFGTEAWTVTLYARNLFDDDTPLAYFDFVDFAAQSKPEKFATPTNPDGYINPATGLTPSGDYPDMGALNPQRGRDWGLEFQWRF